MASQIGLCSCGCHRGIAILHFVECCHGCPECGAKVELSRIKQHVEECRLERMVAVGQSTAYETSEAIDDAIDRWHESPGPDAPCDLHEWLGWSEDAYRAWVELRWDGIGVYDAAKAAAVPVGGVSCKRL